MAGSLLLRRLQRDLLFGTLGLARRLLGIGTLIHRMLPSTFKAKMVESAVLVTAPFPAVVISVAIVVLSLLKPLFFLSLLTLAFSFAFRLFHSLSFSFGLTSTLLIRVVKSHGLAVRGGHGKRSREETFLGDWVSVGILECLLEGATVEHVIVGLFTDGIFVGKELIPGGKGNGRSLR